MSECDSRLAGRREQVKDGKPRDPLFCGVGNNKYGKKSN